MPATFASAESDAWLSAVLLHSTPDARIDQLLHWTSAPSARIAHPREEHLLPLMIALGAAQDDVATRIHHETDYFGALTMSSDRFG